MEGRRRYSRSQSSVLTSPAAPVDRRTRPASQDFDCMSREHVTAMTSQGPMSGIRPSLGSSKDSGIEDGYSDDLNQSQICDLNHSHICDLCQSHLCDLSSLHLSDMAHSSDVSAGCAHQLTPDGADGRLSGSDLSLSASCNICPAAGDPASSACDKPIDRSTPVRSGGDESCEPDEQLQQPDSESDEQQATLSAQHHAATNHAEVTSSLDVTQVTTTAPLQSESPKCGQPAEAAAPAIYTELNADTTVTSQSDQSKSVTSSAVTSEPVTSAPHLALSQHCTDRTPPDSLRCSQEPDDSGSNTYEVNSDSDNDDILEACAAAAQWPGGPAHAHSDSEDDDAFSAQHVQHRSESLAYLRRQHSVHQDSATHPASMEHDLDWEYTGPCHAEGDVSVGDFLRDSQQPEPWLNLAYVGEEELQGGAGAVDSLQDDANVNLLWRIDRNGSAEGEISRPTHVCFMSETKLLVSDYFNQRLQVFNTQGEVVGTLAEGDGKPWAAAVTEHGVIAMLDDGIADVTEFPSRSSVSARRESSCRRTVRMYDRQGAPLDSWGMGEFQRPRGIAYNRLSANWVIVDQRAHALSIHEPDGYCIRRFGSHGNGNTQFDHPSYVTCDANGRILVSDSFNHCVKVFDKYGMYVGQWGSQGHFEYELDLPQGLCAEEATDNVIVCDHSNNRLTRYSPDGRFIDVMLDHVTWPVSVAVNRTGHLALATRSAAHAPYTLGMWVLPVELGLVDDVSNCDELSEDDILDGKEL